MPRFAKMIGEGMLERGHDVEYWTSSRLFSRLPVGHGGVRKWLGYVDQYLIYPPKLANRVSKESSETLFVVADQALGMWVPRIAHRTHVVHCHDFLALRSALGEIPENPTSWTGKRYQALIRDGFSAARNFISVSYQTQTDLHRFLPKAPQLSEVVHNGLNGNFRVLAKSEAEESLTQHLEPDDKDGFLLHVGGNLWYKNREGVIELYRAWCERATTPIPLWMVGGKPNEDLRRSATDMPNGGLVRFVHGLTDEQVIAAYNLASVFLFPSLEEGFGWPIAEAMACGTPVITTNTAPMTEVGGNAAIYLPRFTGNLSAWASHAASVLDHTVTSSCEDRQLRIQQGFSQSNKFSTDKALDAYEAIYQKIGGAPL